MTTILAATIASDQLSPEDAAHFKTDEDMWKKKLRIIWEDVASQQELQTFEVNYVELCANDKASGRYLWIYIPANPI